MGVFRGPFCPAPQTTTDNGGCILPVISPTTSKTVKFNLGFENFFEGFGVIFPFGLAEKKKKRKCWFCFVLCFGLVWFGLVGNYLGAICRHG